MRGTLKRGFKYIEEIDEDNCWYHGFINVNPNFKYLPNWVLNFSIKRVIYVIIGRLQSKEFFQNDVMKEVLEGEGKKAFFDHVK